MVIFWFKEAIKIFGRAKSSFILSLISLSISILLITVSAYSILLSQKVERKIKEQFVLNIFLNDTLSNAIITDLKSIIALKNFCSSVTLIDKETAAKNFIKDTGEDFRKILDYNPMPASLSLKLKADYVEKDSMEIIKKQISVLPGVDEIIYEHETLETFANTLKDIQKYMFIITAILVFVSIYVTYSTIRLVMNLKQEELETMKLVGAKLSTIKLPIIINEIFTGFLASLLSYTLIKALFFSISQYRSFNNLYEPSTNLLMIIFLIGPAIGLIVSVVVLRKITLNI